MKIKQMIHLKVEITDNLFFYMLQNGIPYACECEDAREYWMDEFTFDRRSQLNVLGGIPEAFAQTDWDELCDHINSLYPNIGSTHIESEHRKYVWSEVIDHDMLFETFLENNRAK